MPISVHPLFQDDAAGRLAAYRADSELIRRLRRDFDDARSHGERLAELFDARLITRRPDVHRLLALDAAGRRQELMSSLCTIVSLLDDRHRLHEYLDALAGRLASCAMRPEHDGVVVDTLVDALRELIGSRFDANASEDWRQTLLLICAQMMEARRSANTPPAPR
jgi:hemoglobin-like flavoprotein